MMANIKSAKKRINVTRVKTDQNKSIKSEISTEIKKFKALVAEKKTNEAGVLLSHITSLVDKAAQTNIMHPNKANRVKASLNKSLS